MSAEARGIPPVRLRGMTHSNVNFRAGPTRINHADRSARRLHALDIGMRYTAMSIPPPIPEREIPRPGEPGIEFPREEPPPDEPAPEIPWTEEPEEEPPTPEEPPPGDKPLGA